MVWFSKMRLPLPLTDAQQAIVRSARTSSLTVVTGPPGTGKSYTITAIVLDALLRGESVLVASQMDKAVQVVADNVESIAGRFAIARSGGRAAQRALAKKISRLTGPKQRSLSSRSSELSQVRFDYRELAKRLEDLERRYEKIVQQEFAWSESWQLLERLRSVTSLPIQEVSGRHVRKAQRLVHRARRALDGNPGWMHRWWSRWHRTRAMRSLRTPPGWDCSLDELDELLRVQAQRVTVQEVESKLRAPFPADLVWREIAEVEQCLCNRALQLLTMTREQRLNKLLKNQEQRNQLRRLSTLLRRRRRDLKRELRQSIDSALMLDAFPAWGSTLRTLGEILPATPAMFDLTIIDEASQCDPALASVALVRGKRAVVVGDPHQLRHVCFLSRAREQAAFVSCGLNAEMQERFRYRRSLFDIAADAVDQDHFFLLDQHFRSHPHIIDFSNRMFYDENLRIMTRRPSHTPQSAIRIVHTSGRRLHQSSVNPVEVDAVLEIVTELVDRRPSSTDARSIGIVSPFRDHVDAIRDRIVKDFPATTIQRHGMVVGTAHALQGDEKDIVIFTTSIDAQSHPASLRFLENPNLFNVAITRPRKQLILVTSVGVDDLPAGLLREYLHHAQGHWPASPGDGRTESGFEHQVVVQLKKQQVEIWPSFRAAGVRIAVVATREDRQLAILCDGFADDTPERSSAPGRAPTTVACRLARDEVTASHLARRLVRLLRKDPATTG